MKRYTLLKNENFELILSLDEVGLDYYTNVCIDLFFSQNSIKIYKDNLLSLKNVVNQYNKINTLDANLREDKLGVLLNEYYRGLYENKISDGLILNNKAQWIGEKYCCMTDLEFATWLYRYNGKIILKVTPIFYGFQDEDFALDYNIFIKDYRDVFREEVSLRQLDMTKKMINQIYNTYFD